MVAGAGFALLRYYPFMNYYDKLILACAVPVFVTLGWRWKPVRLLIAGIAVLSLFAIQTYQGDLARADSAFFLKYFLSSQSAILWMSALFVLATLFYWIGLLSRSPTGAAIGSKMTWAAVLMGFVGLMVRWYESYLIGSDVGHIPISNLYEVFVLFSLITALFYLYYEQHYNTRALGAFVLLVISAAVGFLMWYSISRDAQQIQPLVPALQSWWMKIHVPANFIGYGSFALVGDGRRCVPGQGKRHAGGPFAAARSARRPDVQVDRGRFCVLHDRHDPRSIVGCAGLGRLLELGPEGNLGTDRLAELRRLAAHAAHEGPARRCRGMVGADGPAGNDVRVPRRQHVPLRAA